MRGTGIWAIWAMQCNLLSAMDLCRAWTAQFDRVARVRPQAGSPMSRVADIIDGDGITANDNP